MVMAASSVAMVAGALLATGGAGTAMASQVRTEHVILFHNGRTDTTITVPDSCSSEVHSGVYFSAYDYWTDKAYFITNGCGYGVEAAIECSGHWLYGSAVYGTGSGDASFAACNKTYPTYDTFSFVLIT
jgi:hypothetical protein